MPIDPAEWERVKVGVKSSRLILTPKPNSFARFFVGIEWIEQHSLLEDC